MQRMYLGHYPDQVGKTLHTILAEERYHLTGEYRWGELIWCLRIHSVLNPQRQTLLNIAVSEYWVDEQLARDWKDY